MSDPTSQAKQAREILARALGALQSDATAPPQLMNVADPVAQAMGSLHAIERSGNVATALTARDHVRAALGMLQAETSNHPAVATATEAVASSLGIIFGLVKLAEAAAHAPTQVAPHQPHAAQQKPAPQAGYGGAPHQGYGGAPPPQAPPPQAYPQQPGGYPQPAAASPYQQQAPAVQPQAQPPQPPPQQPAQAAPQAPFHASNPFQPTAANKPTPYNAAPSPVAAPPQAPVPAAPAGAARFEASLGVNSATNFYKGLSGNDVIEHGGIFVATYNKVPKVGTPVALRVSLPGGFEFEALAIIAWVRDQRGSDSDMLPGFGARFTQIAPESKQLIYRYVRNREPLFHDDF